jgi:hypothetical protein
MAAAAAGAGSQVVVVAASPTEEPAETVPQTSRMKGGVDRAEERRRRVESLG